MRKRVLTALSFLLCLTPGARADNPLAQTAPADAFLYLHFKGADHLGPAYENSDLKPLLDASNFPQFYHELMPQVLEKALAANPDDAHTLATSLSALEILAHHGFSLYLHPTPIATPNDPPVTVGLSCDAGPDADALEKHLRALDNDKPDLHLSIDRTGTLFSLHVGPIAPDAGPTLAASPAFQSTLKQVAADPVFLAYVDFEKLFSVIDAQPAAANSPWPKFKAAAGLAGLKHYALTGSFAGRDWSAQSFTDAPAPRHGWLALIESAGAPKELLARVPADSTFARTAHVDLAGWLKNFREIAASVAGPDGQQKFDQAVGLVQVYIGRNLATELFGPLGADWTVYSSPAISGSPEQPGFILVNKLVDSEKARNGLVSLTYALANTSQNPSVRAAGFSATAGQDEIAGLKITTLKFSSPNPNLTNLTPAWAIKDGYLYLGPSPKAVAAAASYAGPAFTDSPQLADAHAKIPGAPPESTFEFASITPEAYPALRTIADMGLGMLNSNGIKVSTNPLPPASAVTPHLRPVVELSWTDAAGLHSHSISPFPGASFLTPSGLTSVGGGALLTSIALPSLNRARETANRVKCASNMKQISNAIQMHALEHQGHFPPNLGILASTQDIGADNFYCPDSNSTPTSTGTLMHRGMKLEDVPAHVNAHTDFTYVGQNLTTNSDPTSLVLYEKLDNHTDGMNMAFADGSIQFYLRKDAERILADKHRKPNE